jgi:hypothetical protein
MSGGFIAVVLVEFVEIVDIFQLAGAVNSFAGKGPVRRTLGGRTGGQADDGCGNVFTGDGVAYEEISGRPGFREIVGVGNQLICVGGVRQQGVWIGRRGRNVDLRGWTTLCLFRGFVMREQANAYQDQEGQDQASDAEHEERTKASGTPCGRWRGSLNAGNSRHIRLKTGVRGIVCHSIIQSLRGAGRSRGNSETGSDLRNPFDCKGDEQPGATKVSKLVMI